jgi:hypothetical protein
MAPHHTEKQAIKIEKSDPELAFYFCIFRSRLCLGKLFE